MGAMSALEAPTEEILGDRRRRPAPAHRPPPPRQTVLVCDDDEDTRATVASFLLQQGLGVLEAATAAEALRLARSTTVDVLVLDIMLPDLSGFEVCQQLKQHPRTRRLPVIMITGLTDLTHEVAAIQVGVDAFLVKPVRRTELTRRVVRLM